MFQKCVLFNQYLKLRHQVSYSDTLCKSHNLCKSVICSRLSKYPLIYAVDPQSPNQWFPLKLGHFTSGPPNSQFLYSLWHKIVLSFPPAQTSSYYKSKEQFLFSLSAAKHLPAVASCRFKCHLNILNFLLINCLFISVHSDRLVVAVWISFFVFHLCLYISRCSTYRHRYAWICAYSPVCMCVCVHAIANTHSWRRREDRSVRPLGNYGVAAGILRWWSSWRGRETRREKYLHEDIRGTKNTSDPSFLGPWSTWRECTVFIT